MRDQQPIARRRSDKLNSSGKRLFAHIGSGLLILVIWLVGSEVMWTRMHGDYTIRAQVSAGFKLAYHVRTALESYVEDHGQLPASNDDAGLPPATEISDSIVSNIDVEDGKIVAVYDNNVDPRITGRTIVFEPDVPSDQNVSWACSSPDLPDKWLPSMCQGR